MCNLYIEISNLCAWFGVCFSNPKSLTFRCICYKINNKNDFLKVSLYHNHDCLTDQTL